MTEPVRPPVSRGRSWVRNGDRWTVIGVHRNGSAEVRRQGRRCGSAVLLPTEYVTRHVELGYAVTSHLAQGITSDTAHRAQGVTTDTAHVVVASGTTRENLYVAMTRGRESNTAYVALDRPDVAHVGPRPGDDAASAHSILYGVLHHVGAELSAHETIAAEQDAWGSIAQLAAEYETIAAAAQHDRWVASVCESGLSHDQAETVIDSDAFGPLTAELRRAEAHRFDIGTLLPRVVAAREFEDAQDIAAVLRARIASAIARDAGAGRSRRSQRLIAGLIPRAIGPMDADMRRALDERSGLIEARASAVLDQGLLAGEVWTRSLGAAPRGSAAATWRQHACSVAAYRDRYGIVGPLALGPAPQSIAQRLDAARARAALEAAQRLANEHQSQDAPRPTVGLPSTAIQF